LSAVWPIGEQDNHSAQSKPGKTLGRRATGLMDREE